MEKLESEYPAEFVDKERNRIKRSFPFCIKSLSGFYVQHINDSLFPRFDLKHGDSELVAMLEGAPPLDLQKCGIFRTSVAKYQKQAGFKKSVMVGLGPFSARPRTARYRKRRSNLTGLLSSFA